jgi:hypothetical protein
LSVWLRRRLSFLWTSKPERVHNCPHADAWRLKCAADEIHYTLTPSEARNSACLLAVSSSGGSYEKDMVIGAGVSGFLDGCMWRRGLLRKRSAAAHPSRSDWRRTRTRLCVHQRLLGLARESARLDRRSLGTSSACARRLGGTTLGSTRRTVLLPRRPVALISSASEPAEHREPSAS